MNDPNDTTVDDLLAGLVADQLAGRTPDLQALLDAHPDRAEEIRSRYQDLERLSVLWREGPVAAVQEGFSSGALIGEYEIEREIGRGGMGVVYLARQKDLDRQVALKVIPPTTLSKITRQRFLREAKALASLSHPNIVPVFTAGEQAGSLFIAMEYVPGVPLSTLIRAVRNRPLGKKASIAWAECLASGSAPEDNDSADRTKETAALDSQYLHTCLPIAGQIAGALTRAHAGGVIHRDIKPANIIISSDGRARLLDFGLAAVHTEPHVTVSGEFFGTPHYVSPEQAAGKSALVGPASDQYSLGAMLYECLALRPPFDGDSISVVLSNVLNAEPRGIRQVNPTLPKDIETILAKTLSKRPEDRYDSMDDFAEDLERFASGRPILAKRANWLQRLIKWSRRRPVVAMLLVLMIVMIASGTVVWSWLERRAQLSETQAGEDRAARVAEAEKAEQWRYARLMGQADSKWRTGDAKAAQRLLNETPAKWRGWEWKLLNWRCRSEQQLLAKTDRPAERSLAPIGSVMYLAWSPDGGALAGSSNTGIVRIWDSGTGKVLQSFFPAAGYTGGLAWLDRGKTLAAACADGRVRLWNASTGEMLQVFSGAPPGAGKSGRIITGMAASPDSRHILTVGGELNVKGWGRLYDLKTGALVRSLTGHNSIIDAVVFRPDGKGLVTSGRDGMTHVWDISKTAPIRGIRGHGQGFRFVSDVVLSSDARTLATAGEDGLVQLWDANAGKTINTLRSTGASVRALEFSPDGSTLAGAANDGVATLWDVSTGKVITMFRSNEALSLSIGFAPDGKHLATGGYGGVKIWNLATRQEGVSFGQKGAFPTFTCDSARIAAVNAPDGGVSIWSGDARKLVAQVRSLGNQITEAACHPVNTDLLACIDKEGVVRLWSLSENISVWTVRPASDDKKVRRGLAFSPDGQFLAVGKFGSWRSKQRRPASVELRRTDSGTLLNNLTFPHCDTITGVAFSPDGAYVAASSWYLHPPDSGGQVPGGVALWRLSDGQYVRTLFGQDGGLYSFAFSPDGRLIALGNNNNVIRVLDVKTAEVRSVMRGHTSRVVALDFSPDGRRIVAAGFKQIMLWDLLTSQSVTTLWSNKDGHKRQFHSVAFSPDGSAIVAGGKDRQMRIWSIPKNGPASGAPASRPAGAH